MKWKIGLMVVLLLCVLMLPLIATAEIVSSGKCGDNLTYALTDDGILTISGTGEMYDFEYPSYAPWTRGVTKVIIHEGVTSIGNHAFYYCGNLASITIPTSLTNIGSEAFYSCGNLTSITIPDGVNTIGSNAFIYCPAKMYAHLGTEGAKALGKQRKSFRMPDTNYDLQYYFNNEGMADLAIFNVDKDVKSFTIPNGVTQIGNDAFSGCSSLTSITIPNSVTRIGDDAFRGCSSLTSITIPNSVTQIGENAFRYCNRLANINIPNGVTSIEYGMFGDCKSLTSIYIPRSVNFIMDFSFVGCNSLSKVYIAGEHVEIRDGAFWSNPTIYCFRYTEVDTWATRRGYRVVYLDDLSDSYTVKLPDDFRMYRGETRQIPAIVVPDDGAAIQWTSSDPSIVSVDQGLVKANAPGTATITADVGKASGSVKITVYIAAESFEIVPAETWIVARTSRQLSIQNILPENAETNITWKSVNTTTADVDNNGLVNAYSVGDVIISAYTSNGIQREAVVHVCYPVTEIAFANEQTALKPGETLQLTANVTMRTQSCVNHLVTFTSSDETVATVNASGLVTALKPGTAKITATAESGVSAALEIKVKDVEPESLPGDCNSDGIVDGRDLLRLAKYLAGQDVTIDEKAADLTGDGVVDGRDVLRLAKQLAGM